MGTGAIVRLAFSSGLLLLPEIASGQLAASGGIAGIVRDTTGAVLPRRGR